MQVRDHIELSAINILANFNQQVLSHFCYLQMAKISARSVLMEQIIQVYLTGRWE